MHRSARARRALPPMIALGLAASALTLGGPAAQADTVTDLSGLVTNAAGAGLVNVDVVAYTTPSDGSQPVPVDADTTDATGRYELTDLDPATLATSTNPAVRTENDFKLFFVDDNGTATSAHETGYLSRGLGGSKSLSGAKSVVVPAGGAATAPTQALPQAAGLLVRVVDPSGAAISETRDAAGDYLGGGAFADVYEADAADPTEAYVMGGSDSDDNGFYTAATPAQPVPLDGLIYVRGLEPAVAYAVDGGGSRYNAASGATTSYVTRFLGGNGTYAEASPVTPAAGQFAPVTIQVSDKLTAAEKPRIIGNSSFGSTLRADRGSWIDESDTDFTYQWYRNGSPVAGATLSSYRVSKADKKKKIGLVVTAARGTFVGSAVADPTSKVGEKSKVKAKRDGYGFDVTVKVAKKSKAKKLGTPKGKVALFTEDGELASKKVKLRGGAVEDLTPKRAFLGETRYVVTYLGGGKLGSDTATAKAGKGKGKK